MKNYFTSESVTCGHPDKVADQIADAILDELLKEDPDSRVACEVTCTTDQVHVFGEITTRGDVDYEKVVRDTVRRIGYVEKGHGFDYESCRVIIDLDRQSPDISQGVTSENIEDQGAGDQGIMFGYACNQTASLMPLPIELAHRLARRLQEVRENGTLPYLLPDGKSQVTVEYDCGKPVRIEAVVISSQHQKDVDIEQLRQDIRKEVIDASIDSSLMDDNTKIYINPTGRFVIGGPAGDSGLTGRKLIVDSYGGYCRHGGGAISGKDASKVDRTGAYLGRYLAKNIVASGLADECEVQLGYAIGVARPLSVRIETFGSEHCDVDKLQQYIMDNVDCRPGAAIRKFDLKRPVFSRVACYGQFGENAAEMPWEQTDLKITI